jgi:hypothetical protein
MILVKSYKYIEFIFDIEENGYLFTERNPTYYFRIRW